MQKWFAGLLKLGLLVFVSIGLGLAQAIEVPDDLSGMTLEDLLNQKVGVASHKATTARKSPGVISVITADDIKLMGARDLIDVLSLVPGFSFSGDVYSIDGLSVRGIYSNEGRALLLIDGIMMNETLYGNFPLYGRYPVSQIEKIEIIRGAGSVIYGGFAALAVINVSTKGASGRERCMFNGVYGQQVNTRGREGLGFVCRKKVGPTVMDLGVASNTSRRSGRSSSNFDTSVPPTVEYPFSLKDGKPINSVYLNAGIQVSDLKVRAIVDRYVVPNRSGYGTENLPSTFDNRFDSYNGTVSYEGHVTSGFTLTPSYSIKVDTPWQVKDTSVGNGLYFDERNTRQVLSLLGSYEIRDDLTLLVGGENTRDNVHTAEAASPFINGSSDIKYHSNALFSQLEWESETFSLAVGARYENHSAFDPAFVPRLAATKQMGAWHVKTLYSQAYRNPSIENINGFDYVNYKLKPEKTNDLELEGGYQYSRDGLLTLDVFDTRITDAIIYVSATDSYITAPKLGTRGFELEHHYRRSWGFSNLGYSFYKVSSNEVDSYRVDENRNVLLGAPQHKLTWFGSYRLSDHLSVSPSLIYFGTNWSNSYSRSADAYVGQKLDPVTLLNINFGYVDLFGVKGLSTALGVFNAFNQRNDFVMAYRSEHEDVPGPTREIVARVGYSQDF